MLSLAAVSSFAAVQNVSDCKTDAATYDGQEVTLTGVVISNANYKAVHIWQDENGNGLFDANECAQVYANTSGTLDAFTIGTEITVTGTGAIYPTDSGIFELKYDAGTVTSNSTGNTIPEPVAVTCAQINNSTAANDTVAFGYEGALIKMSGATCTAEPDSQYFVGALSDDATNTIKNDDVVWYHYGDTSPFVLNAEYNVTGVLVYSSYDGYTICPRSGADVASSSGNNPPSVSNVMAYPGLIAQSTSTDVVFLAKASDSDGTLSSVTVDVASGTYTATLLDDGNAPDFAAADGIFAGTVSAANFAAAGDVSYTVTATDDASATTDVTQALKVYDASYLAALPNIATAKTVADGAAMATKGTLSHAGNAFYNALYIQDASSGTQASFYGTSLFDYVEALGLVEGDELAVAGIKGAFKGMTQIQPDNGVLLVAKIADSTGPVAPAEMTMAAYEAAYDVNEGRLVKFVNCNKYAGGDFVATNRPLITDEALQYDGEGALIDPTNWAELYLTSNNIDLTNYPTDLTALDFVVGVAYHTEVSTGTKIRIYARDNDDVPAPTAVEGVIWTLMK